MSLSYLSSLTGKKIRTYKGGPESKEGQLLYVKPDYLALLTDDNEVVYYQLQHLKSMVEDSKSQVESMEENTELSFLEADSFSGMLEQMVGEAVQINRGGPESVKGTLLSMENDFLAINTEKNGVIYYQIHHIKSVSVNNTSTEEGTTKNNFVAMTQPVTRTASSFATLMNQFENSWVTINRGGPESVEGIVTYIGDGFVTLINGEKVYRITTFHIRNISHGSKQDQKTQNNNNNESEEDVSVSSADAQSTSGGSDGDGGGGDGKGGSKSKSSSKKGKSSKEKKEILELLLQQVSLNLEDTLKKAKERLK